ncbi:MAG TPA: glycosyltransferase family 39 protein [Planctomycetota bacterium]|nr:glycosyltransferase family 39 protein [Planctomycetota bacterium]
MLDRIYQKWIEFTTILEHDYEEKIFERIFFYFFLFAFFCYLCILGLQPVRNTMEARNFKTAEEIVESNEWLVPTLNNEARILKPPFPTWSVAAIKMLFHDTRNLWILRFPNLCIAFFLVFMVWKLAKTLFNARTALFASIMLATSINFLGDALISRWDMFACAFGIAGIYSILKMYASTTKKIVVKYFIFSVLFFTLSYFSKGPAALLTLLGSLYVTWCFILLLNKIKQNSLTQNIIENYHPFFPKSYKGWLLLLLIIISTFLIGNIWWIVIKFQEPEAWTLIFKDIGSLKIKHAEPFYYYILLSVAYIGIWSVFLIFAFMYPILLFIQKNKLSTIEKKQQASIYFTWIWYFIGIIFLSFVSAKKNRYFLMILPTCCLMVAVYADFIVSWIQGKKEKWHYIIFVLHKYLLSFALICSAIALIVGIFLGCSLWTLLFIPSLLILSYICYKGELQITKFVIEYGWIACWIILIAFTTLYSGGAFPNRYENAEQVQTITNDDPLYIACQGNDKLLWAIHREGIFIHINQKFIENLLGQSRFYILLPKESEQNIQSILQKAKKVFTFYEKQTRETITWNLYQFQ